MNKYKKAIESVQYLDEMFSSVKDMADVLKGVSSLEDEAAILENKKKKLDSEFNSAKERNDTLIKENESLLSEQNELQDKSKSILSEATEKGQAIVKEAVSKKQNIEYVISDLKKTVQDLEQGKTEELLSLGQEIDDKKKELSNLVGQIASTKDSLRKLIG